MIKCLFLIATFLLSGLSFSAEHQMIDTLGTSRKGQFVAIEEYGYKAQTHTYYVTIKILNVWTKKYVGQRTEVELPALRPDYLLKARSQARLLSIDNLRSFGISG